MNQKKILHLIFAILQNESFDSKIEKNEKKNQKNRKKKYFCDPKHNWFKCFYLISIIRLSDWTFNAIIKKKIAEKMKKNQRLTKIIENVKKQIKKIRKKNQTLKNQIYFQLFFSKIRFHQQSYSRFWMFFQQCNKFTNWSTSEF